LLNTSPTWILSPLLTYMFFNSCQSEILSNCLPLLTY
jgi:hypothetical protein